MSDISLNDIFNKDALPDDEEIPSVDDWVDDLDAEEMQNVVFILSQVDPLDVKLNAEQRDLVMQARKVWKAAGL